MARAEGVPRSARLMAHLAIENTTRFAFEVPHVVDETLRPWVGRSGHAEPIARASRTRSPLKGRP
jgi:hypothetical protein